MLEQGVTAVHTTRSLPVAGWASATAWCGPVIHSIRVDDEDPAVMAASGCSIAHTPVSNLKRGSSVMPFRRIRDVGINVAFEGCFAVVSRERIESHRPTPSGNPCANCRRFVRTTVERGQLRVRLRG
jgi:hypothetical protein